MGEACQAPAHRGSASPCRPDRSRPRRQTQRTGDRSGRARASGVPRPAPPEPEGGSADPPPDPAGRLPCPIPSSGVVPRGGRARGRSTSGGLHVAGQIREQPERSVLSNSSSFELPAREEACWLTTGEVASELCWFDTGGCADSGSPSSKRVGTVISATASAIATGRRRRSRRSCQRSRARSLIAGGS